VQSWRRCQEVITTIFTMLSQHSVEMGEASFQGREWWYQFLRQQSPLLSLFRRHT